MSEKPKSHVALVAVRMSHGFKTTEPQAIVVGTMPSDVAGWKEGDWRYVTYPLDALLKMLDAGKEDPLVPAADGDQGRHAVWATAAEALTKKNRFAGAERKAVDALFPKDYLNGTVKVSSGGTTSNLQRVFAAFPLRSIERTFFYGFAKGEVTSKLLEPFAALHTARVVLPMPKAAPPAAFGAIEPAGDDPGSRIVLIPDFSDPKRVGLLSAMALQFEIKVAVSGHNAVQGQQSATDPLMLLDAAVVNDGGSLWVLADGKPNDVRGANFDLLRLRCTLGGGMTNVGIVVSEGVRDLIRLAEDESKRALIDFHEIGQKVTDCGVERAVGPYIVKVVPAIDHVRLPAPKNVGAHRRFGFRILDSAAATPLKIGWRFELSIFQYGRPFARRMLGTLIPEHKIDGKGLESRLVGATKIELAEEQRVEDIVFALERESRTAFTARFVDDEKQNALNETLTKHVLAVADENIANIQTGLKRVRDGRPISLLPRLVREAGFLSWNAAGQLVNSAPSRRLPPNEPDTSRSGRLIVFEPAVAEDIWKREPKAAEIRATATFRFFLNEERGFPKYRALIGAPRSSAQPFQSLASTDPRATPRGTRFRLKLDTRMKEGGPRQTSVLIGALELTLGDQFIEESKFETHGEITLVPLAGDAGGDADQLRTAIDGEIIVPVLRVDPGIQDDPERDVIVNARQRRSRELAVAEPDRSAPLLLPLTARTLADGGKASMKLTAEEVATRDRDHTLALSLRAIEERDASSTPAAATGGRVLVIDPRPFRIAAIEYQPISSTATSESNEVAVWNAEGEGGLSWRVRDDGQSVGIELPPQVLGEAMEKNRSTLEDKPKDILPDKPSAARFGSSTRLRIDPTFADTRFREPGWNLRRILGNALQRLPGARLLDLRLELLYGLLTRVRTEGLLLTELTGAIGEPALPLFDTGESLEEHLRRHKEHIDEILGAERFRLAVDKVYRTRPDEYLRIEEGASFKLRLQPRTPLRWPTPGGIPTDTGGLIKPEVLQRTFSSSDRDTESFPGGLSWAFESANVLMSVYGRHDGDGGSVSGIYLSAHGGYGSQRALFDARKTIVESETTQGRVHRYRLERIGRIGCLWHRAKHVIVYERTVVPSAQFYNAAPIGLRQDEHAGRAIPRKVEEYVEILQPVRHYPEDGSSIRTAGCLLAAEFKSIRIRVDSDWGSDVRREGFQVPLWNASFEGLPGNPDNPDDPASIYPKPQIRLTFAGREKNVTLEIDEPAKLVFYTSVLREEDDRTDLWKPVRDVDFCDAPRVSPGRVQTQSEDLTDAILPPEPEHVPGYERFTISLVPSKDAVALAHGRVADGPIATLRNVTIARSVALSAEQPAPEFGLGLGAKVANVRAELDRQIGRVVGVLEKLDRDTDPQTLATQANNLIADACGKLNLTLDRIEGLRDPNLLAGLKQSCSGIAAQARAHVDGQLTRFLTIAGALLDSSAKSILERIDAAGGVIDSEIAVVDGMAAQIAQAARDVERTPAELKRVLADLRAALNNNRVRIKELKDNGRARIKTRIAAVKKNLDAGLADLAVDLDEARKKTKANLSAVRQLLGTAAVAEADKLADVVDEVNDEVARCHTELTNGAGTITGPARTAATAAKKKVEAARAEIAKVRDKAPEGARRLIEKIEGSLANVVSLATWVENAVDKEAAEVLELATRAKTHADAVAKEFRAAKEQVTGIGMDELKKIEEQLAAILDQAVVEAKALIQAAEGEKKKIFDALDDVDTNCQKALDDAETAVNKQLDLLVPLIDDDNMPADFVEKLKTIETEIRAAATQARQTLVKAAAEAKTARENLTGAIQQRTQSLQAILDAAAATVRGQAETLIRQIEAQCERLVGEFDKLKANVVDHIDRRIRDAIDVDYLRRDLERDLKAIVGDGTAALAEIKAKASAKAAELTRAAETRVREAAATVQRTVQNVVGTDLADVARRAEGVYQKGDDALRLIRAVGDPPKTDSLGFNRPEVAYVFGEARELGIDMTPALALVNRAADQIAAVDKAGKAVGELLDSFGVRLPVTQIADQLIPEKLRNLSVSDLLPDMGGIDLRGLLQRVGFPDLDDSDAVKVRHGFDKAERRAWMEADVDVPFAESVALLSFGPVQVLIDRAKFTSRARLSASAGGGLQRAMNGRIFGDWRVLCGGQTILTFRQSELRFDDSGRIDFQIQPERVELAAALQFLTDLMRVTGQKGGVRVEPFLRGGVPSGVAATLDMVLPPIQTGAFGISDLSLHVLFGVAAIPRVEIVTDLAIGSRLTPFGLNVWILTGGGYVMQRLSYVPMAKPQPLLTYTLDVAVLAGLGIGFSFGVVSGGVWLQVGCGIALTWTTGAGGNSTTVRVFLLARGNVDVAGIITASIALLFEISYDGERMIGAGTLSIHVKISVFFTLDVDQHVEYVFAGQKKQDAVEGGGNSADAYC